MADDVLTSEWANELRASHEPKQWLGAKDVFVLANVLRRPIIVHGPQEIDESQVGGGACFHQDWLLAAVPTSLFRCRSFD